MAWKQTNFQFSGPTIYSYRGLLHLVVFGTFEWRNKELDLLTANYQSISS